MTINSLKGYDSGYTEQEIAQMKQMHKDMANAGTIETPPDTFYDDMLKLSDGTTFKHPLSYPAEYYYEQNKTAPDVIAEDDEDNYLVKQVDKMMGTD